MTQPLTKEELIRGAWITALRRQGARQCERHVFEKGTLRVCALGLLAEIAGIGRIAKAIVARHGEFDFIGRRAGLSKRQTEDVWKMNDGYAPFETPKHTFSEIADVVEGWFKKSG